MKYLVKVLDDNQYEIKSKTDAKHKPRGGNYIFVEGVDTAYPLMQENEDGSLEIIEFEAPKLLKEAYAKMDSDIVTDGAAIFQTNNRESMLVGVDELQLRVMAADMFTNDGEVTAVITESFETIGTELLTAEDIKKYYAEVLYTMFKSRRQHIGVYLAKKAELGV